MSSFHCFRRLRHFVPADAFACLAYGCASSAPPRDVAGLEKVTGVRGLTTPTWAAGALSSKREPAAFGVKTVSPRRAFTRRRPIHITGKTQ